LVAKISSLPVLSAATVYYFGFGVDNLFRFLCDFEKSKHPKDLLQPVNCDLSYTMQSVVSSQPHLELASDDSGFAALSRFVIANGMEAEVKAAFRARPHLVDNAEGFRRMDVISPLARPQEIWLLTFWTDRKSFEAWHHSHMYHDSHRGIPKGLKLVPGETQMSHFEHISS
jgi:heme-degrading monooxygenase HmoA